MGGGGYVQAVMGGPKHMVVLIFNQNKNKNKKIRCF